MTEKHYLKIISDLFRLTGYATGIMKGTYDINETGEGKNRGLINAIKYLEEQQNLILMELGEK